MSQTLVKNFLHIVFSTKNRVPLIHEDMEEGLYAYVAGIFKNLDCTPIKMGGYRNHVHLLINLSKNYSLSKVMTHVKSNSSKWMKSEGNIKGFQWQAGYAAFSVSEKDVENVKRYVSNQKEHHEKGRLLDFRLSFGLYWKKMMWYSMKGICGTNRNGTSPCCVALSGLILVNAFIF